MIYKAPTSIKNQGTCHSVCLSVCVSFCLSVCLCLYDSVGVCVCVSDLQTYCQSLNCDEQCEVVQGFDVTTQQTVARAYCVCNIGYTRVRVLEGLSCASQ